ncbi:MAG: amidohydrolase family protein [bacterium]|nr:amidohydrolase family protein [bacterium]
MTRLAICNARAVLPDRMEDNVNIVCRNGLIESVSADTIADSTDLLRMDAEGQLVVPGYIDIHVHGGAGADFMDGDVDSIRTAAKAHLRHGTTTLFPTTTTGSAKQILNMIDACRENSAEPDLPWLPGIHLYGPYFAADKVGCHSLDGRRSPESDEYQRYFATEFVRIATCAAELDGAEDFYRAAAKHNCLITCGHSNASWAEMQAAYEAGMRHVDHFWCAMSSVPSLRQRLGVPMQASMAEFVLMTPEMSTEVIADGYHLSPELLEFAYRMLGPDRLCLVTDCNRALDLPAGDYRFGSQQDGSWFYSDGRVGWAPDRSSLASSVVGMDHMVRHMRQSTTASLPEVIRMASLTPARRAGISDRTGSLQVGKQADLLILNSELEIQRVIARGNPVS